MARPSVAAERRKQIIEATLQTIMERGIGGATLDRIAETAGMSRGHVRHFVGNRDRLLVDAAAAFYADGDGATAILPASVATLEEAVDHLFDEEFAASDSENAIVLGFVEAARTNSEIALILARAYSSTRARLQVFIGSAKPHVDPAACDVIAQGMLSIALGNVFIGDFDSEPGRTCRARSAAERLLESS